MVGEQLNKLILGHFSNLHDSMKNHAEFKLAAKTLFKRTSQTKLITPLLSFKMSVVRILLCNERQLKVC